MKNRYSLDLLVGIQNQFTKSSRDIQQEYKKLSSEHNKLQSTVKDVDAYKKAQAELKAYQEQIRKTGTPTDEAEAKLQAMSNALARQSRALKKAGVDTDDLAQAQQRLQQELKQSAQGLNNLSRVPMPSADTLAGIGVGAGVTTMAAQSGMNTNMLERQAAAAMQGGTPEERLAKVQQWRNELADIETQTARPYEEILQARIQATQAGFDDDESLSLTRTSAQLSAVFKNLNWQPQEVMAAQMRLMRSFDISAEKAADLIAATAQKSGDDKGDLLDTLTEYSSTLADQGLSADTVFAQLIAGRQGGTYNYDKIGDSLKEMFQARLSDPDEFKKLVGDGSKAGTIDTLIGDSATADALKSSLFDMRHAMQSGEGVGDAYSKMMQQLAMLYETDKGVARNVAEGIGGNILAEDIGVRGIQGMAKASLDASAFLGEYEGALDDAMDIALSPTQKLIAEVSAMGRAASTSLTELENLSEGLLDFIAQGASSVRESANDNVLMAGALTAGAAAVSGYGAMKGAGMVKNIFKHWGKGKTPDVPTSKSMPDSLTGLIDGAEKQAGKSRNLGAMLGGVTDKLNLQTLGKVFKPLAFVASAVPLAQSLSEGDYEQAGKSAGSLGGGLAGMKLGAMAGMLGGPIGAGVGGIAGGVLGSLLGEQAIEGIMNWFSPGADKDIAQAVQIADEAEQRATASKIDAPIQIAISAPVTIESGSTVPENFEQQLMNALRNITPELTMQLRETLDGMADA